MCHKVFDILKQHHERDDIKLERYPDIQDQDNASENVTEGPMHAAGEDFVFHAIVKTILSQATNNENALTVEQTLIDRFRYNFLGVKVKGTSPNYHAMRLAPQAKLAKALASGGLHNTKAKQILVCLNHVYDRNYATATDEEKIQDARMGESYDFVPGLLSLSYMLPMTLQEKFDHLVSMPGIGVKTAACILCFSFEYPVFAVDTHVIRLSRLLRWLPLNISNVDHAFMHLDRRVPGPLKYGLHQAFWHHGQFCIRCRAGTDENTKGWKETVCPIEHLVDRSRKDLVKNKKPKVEKDAAEDDNNNNNNGNDDGVEKLKKIKPRPHVYPHAKLTPEQAEELGYELRTIVIDDGFGVRRANFSGKPLLKWVLKSDHDAMDETDRKATVEDIKEEKAEAEAEAEAKTEAEAENADGEDVEVDGSDSELEAEEE